MRDARTIVSVHIPKTAGWSFRTGLLSAFGERLLLDYSDRPLDGTPSARWRRLRARIAFSSVVIVMFVYVLASAWACSGVIGGGRHGEAGCCD